MKIRITYNNGRILEDRVNYLHVASGKVFYTVDSRAHEVFQNQVVIPLENIKEFHAVAF